MRKSFCRTRGYDPATGRRPREQGHGLAAATFRHVASRNLDPQLHTHAVIANMTRNGDGDWRSAEFTALERSKLLIGAYYRNELRTRLEEIGYATERTLVGRMPGFEIAGYQRPLLDAFSTRRRDLLDYMEERGWENTPARTQQAALYTRRRKDEPERQVLSATWQARAEEIGPARDRDIARGRRRGHATIRRPEHAHPSALSVVQRAVEHLEERRTVFSANELRAWALAHGGGRHSLSALDGAVERLRRDGHLVEATAHRADLAFVTDRALDAERGIIAGMRAGLDASRALAEEATVEAGLDEAGLNAGQRDAARTILLSSHWTVGVQGHAGSGKTTMLRAVASLAGEHRIVGLAPSASAARVLEDEAGIPARTLQGFLSRYRDIGDGIAGAERMAEARETLGGGILVLDEASMVGTRQMRSLMRIAEQTGVERLALVGDRQQLRAVDAGEPFALLQDAGMPTARMEEIVRQRDAGLRQAVLHVVADAPRLAVEGLGNGVLEMDGDELGHTAARLWLDLGDEEREGTEILAPTHAIRGEINGAVREGLAQEGVLRGRELEIERYVNLRLTRSQKGEATNYRPGDVAVFHYDTYGIRARAGDVCRVTEVDGGTVRVAHPDGRERRFDPSGYVRYRLELYETVPMSLRAGDQVRWTRNDAERSLINGERAEVLSIGRKRLRMRTQDGRELGFARDDPQLHHLDYAYSSTVHAAQGRTCDNVIAVLDSDGGALADQAAFYVELSRARDSVVLLTDDREALIETLETASGEELSALKAIGEQFAIPEKETEAGSIVQKTPVLSSAERERRQDLERFVEETLSAAAASVREREERKREAGVAGVKFEPGEPDWTEDAITALERCDRILEDPAKYARTLDHRPGATKEMARLAQRLDAALAEDEAELERRRKREYGRHWSWGRGFSM